MQSSASPTRQRRWLLTLWASRGMAIKLLDVEGAPAIPGALGRCQDFLTVNHPVFPFATPAEYVKFFDIRAKPRAMGELVAATWLALFHRRSRKIVTGLLSGVIRPASMAGDLLAAAWLALFHPRHATIATEILLEVVAGPLVTYWSGSPYWLGPSGTTGGHAVKYSLVPRFETTAPPSALKGKPGDYLTQDPEPVPENPGSGLRIPSSTSG